MANTNFQTEANRRLKVHRNLGRVSGGIGGNSEFIDFLTDVNVKRPPPSLTRINQLMSNRQLSREQTKELQFNVQGIRRFLGGETISSIQNSEIDFDAAKGKQRPVVSDLATDFRDEGAVTDGTAEGVGKTITNASRGRRERRGGLLSNSGSGGLLG